MSCFFLAGIHVHMPDTLSTDPHSEHGCYSRHVHPPFMELEMVTQVHTMTLSPGTSAHPCVKTARLEFIKMHIKIKLTTYGMNKQGWVKSITKMNWIFH